MKPVTASQDTGSPQGWPRATRSGRPGPGGGQRVQPGVPGIGAERGGIDAPADQQLVAGHHLIADDAQGRPGDARADVGRRTVLDQLADALEAGDAALTQMTMAIPMPARSSARSRP